MPRQSKIFRIFVSSTFEDMREERNTLQAGAFSRLRDYCRDLGWQFQAVDLRWGISEEATIDQKTMEICLREIQRCQEQSPRPNFIVLLGERYGWRPLPDRIWQSVQILMQADLPAELSTLFHEWYELDENQLPEPVWVLKPRQGRYLDYNIYDAKVQIPLFTFFTNWAASHLPDPDKIENMNNIQALQRLKLERSATEQEIQAGAFRVENAPEHVFAFLRELPAIAHNCKSFHDEDQSQIKRLHEHILNYLPDKNVYRKTVAWDKTTGRPDANHLEELDLKVESFLKVLIDAEIERYQQTDENLLEDETHAAFAKERTYGFSGREKDITAISIYAKSDSKSPFVLWGASGTGKSTLMAQAAFKVQEIIPQALVMTRFIGITGKASNGSSLLKDICHNLCQRYGGDIAQIPEEPTKLEIVFNDYLAKATPEQPLVLFIDALDQFSEYDAARKLNWLPQTLPPNVRLILSTLVVDCLDILRRRNNPTPLFHEITQLTSEDGRFALQAWLSKAHRKLQSHQIDQIIREFDHAARAPLYLHLAFDRAQHWKSQDEETRLGQTVQDLITELYTNLSKPSAHGNLIVEKVLTALRCAKQGLSDDEILGVLAQDNDYWHHLVSSSKHSFDNATDVSQRRIPPVLWIRLYHDLEFYLSRRNAPGGEVVTFYHRQLAEAIDRMYLCDTAIKKQRHSALANYFTGKRWLFKEDAPLISNARKCDELPWQRIKSEDWDAVVNTLCDLDFIQAKAAAKLTYEMVEDYNLALNNIPDNAENIRIENERQARMQKYTQDLIAYAKGDIKELDIPQSITPWSEERIDAEIERIKKNPTRLDRLNDFYPFIGQNAYILQIFTVTIPNLVYQQAWNFADFGILNSAAEKIVQANSAYLLLSKDNQRTVYNPFPLVLKTLTGHNNSLYGVRLSNDGTWAVTEAADRSKDYQTQTILWDLLRGQAIKKLYGKIDYLESFGIEPHLKRFNPQIEDNNCVIRDSHTNEVVHSFKGYKYCFYPITPNGKRAVSNSDDNSFTLWDMENEEVIKKYNGRCEELTADGKLAIIRYNYSTYALFNLDTNQLVRTIKVSYWSAYPLYITPDGKRAFTGSLSGICSYWDLERGKSDNRLWRHNDSVVSLCITPNGKMAISGSRDGKCMLWNLENGQPQDTIIEDFSFTSTIRCSPNGNRLIYGSTDESCILVDLSGTHTHTAIHEFKGFNTVIELTPDGTRALTLNDWGGCSVLNITTCHAITGLPFSMSSEASIEITPDGKMVILVATGSLQGSALFDLERCSLLRRFSERVRSVSVLPDGRRAVSIEWDKTLLLWNLESGKTIRRKSDVVSACLTPDGKKAFLVLKDEMTCILWDIVNWKAIHKLEGHTALISTTAISIDGTKAISGSRDRLIVIWDIPSGRSIAVYSLQDSIETFKMYKDGIVLGGTSGLVLNLKIDHKLTCPERGIITAREIWDFDNHRFMPLSADCPFCGHRFGPEKLVVKTINSITDRYKLALGQSLCLDLPDEAWEDPGLLSKCPKCGEGLKFNPFFPVHLNEDVEAIEQAMDKETKKTPDVTISIPDGVVIVEEKSKISFPNIAKFIQPDSIFYQKEEIQEDTGIKQATTESLWKVAEQSYNKGYWEVAIASLQKLTAKGETSDDISEMLIISMLNGYKNLSEKNITEIGQHLKQLEVNGNTAKAGELREMLNHKINPVTPQKKKPWWKIK